MNVLWLLWAFFYFAGTCCVIAAGLALPLVLPFILIGLLLLIPIAIARRAVLHLRGL